MHPGGRPKKPQYKIKTMVKRMQEYIRDCNVDGTQTLPDGRRKPVHVPILKECCLKNNWNYDYLHELARENEELSLTIKELIGWKEVILEQGMLTGVFRPGAAIFSLKQLGWTDRQDIKLQKTETVDDDELTKALEEIAKKL